MFNIFKKKQPTIQERVKGATQKILTREEAVIYRSLLQEKERQFQIITNPKQLKTLHEDILELRTMLFANNAL